ncbi:MAG: hypothetical protein P8184_14695 [Calditrichia bacterium]
MQPYLNKSIFLIVIILMMGCGSTKKLTGNPQPLGYIPFSAGSMTGNPEELDRQLLDDLQNSGSFYLHRMDSVPALWDLPQMRSEKDSLVQWIVTGRYISENIERKKGSLIPFVIYRPRTELSVRMEYRIYNSSKKGWEDIGEILARKSVRGTTQVMMYDESDPSLALDARERQILRREVYQLANNELIQKIESLIKIKR